MSQGIYNPGSPSVALITVSIDPALAEEVASAISEMPWTVRRADCEGYISASRRPPFSQAVKSAHYCIAVIDLDTDMDQAIEAAAYIQEMYSGKAALVARSISQDHEILLRAMRAGFNDFIGETFNREAFGETLGRINALWQTRATSNAVRGSVVSLIGTKGGVGTTTLAVHLAMYLVQTHGKKTLLIDNHAQLGHACVYLGIDGSRHNFHELVRNLSRLDSELLRGYIATHASGLEVLSSPDVCDNHRATDPASMSQTLDFLRGEYDYVIVDCPASLDETNLAVIEGSNLVYLIATPEIGAVRDLSRFVDSLSQNDENKERLKVVINRFSSQHAVGPEQIEKAIRMEIFMKLPNSYAEVVRSGILGEPVGPKQKSEFGAQIAKWVSTLAGPGIGPEAPAPKKSGFSLWK
ncbi:MAG TPA: AAA family ATPase [Acidobacteriaceae bacterium]|nr:AAA family ATPase [Acidobacteriaceae bacterium]